MALSGGMVAPTSTGQTDWSQTKQQIKDECSGRSDAAACRKRKRARMSQTPTAASTTTPGSAPGGGGQYNPAHAAPVAAGGYNQQIGDSTAHAPAGTYAAGLGTYGLGTAGNNPAALVQNYMSGQFGTAPNSMSTNIANQYLAPTSARTQAILGSLPGSNIDAANFGAALLNQLGGSTGAQLDPIRMISTIVNGIQNAGGEHLDPGSVGPGTFASVLNNPDPLKGIDSLISMIGGALQGTMPDEALGSWLDSLQAYATQFITDQGGLMNQSLNQIAGDEGGGRGWFDQLLGSLGPSLGLQ
jgi:hypothetical protein